MAGDDKGLLEDLIGDSLEETQPSVKGKGKMPAMSPADDFGDPTADPMDDEQLMGELLRKKSSGGNKRLVALSVLLILFGLLGAGVKFGFIPLPGLSKKGKPQVLPFANVDKTKMSQPMKPLTPTAPSAPSAPVVPSSENPNAVAAANNPASQPAQPVAQAPSMQPAQPPKIDSAPAPVTPQSAVAPVQPAQPKAPVAPPAAVAPAQPAPVVTTPPVVAKRAAPSERMENTRMAESPAPSSSSENGKYSIQIGAYLYKESLKQPMQTVVKMGFKPTISLGKHSFTMSRVLVGKFKSKQVAEAAIKDLSEEGIKAQLVKNNSGTYSALTGTFLKPHEAEKQRKKLEEFGYDVAVDQSKVHKNLQELRIGSYSSEQDAQSDLQRLKAKGLSPVVVSVQ